MAARKSSGRLDWEDLRALVALAKEGSLSGAARALGVTHVTVSRRIASLEGDLGHPVLTRDLGRYILTEGGKRILEHAASMSQSADAILRVASSFAETLTGPVRITATEAVGMHIVVPALKAVHEAYPDLDLELDITQANVNLARNDADIAVRLARPPEGSGLVGSHVGNIGYHIFGSRTYVAEVPSDRYEFIGYPTEFADWIESKTLAAVAQDCRMSMRVNHLSNRIAATRQGLGLSLIPDFIATSFPDLVRVSRGDPLMIRELHVLTHIDLSEVPRIKAAMDVMSRAILDAPELDVRARALSESERGRIDFNPRIEAQVPAVNTKPAAIAANDPVD